MDALLQLLLTGPPDIDGVERSQRTLDLLNLKVNGHEVEWFDRSFDDLISKLLRQSQRWAVIFEAYYDQLDYTCRLDVDTVATKLRSNLDRKTRQEGFIILPSF